MINYKLLFTVALLFTLACPGVQAAHEKPQPGDKMAWVHVKDSKFRATGNSERAALIAVRHLFETTGCKTRRIAMPFVQHRPRYKVTYNIRCQPGSISRWLKANGY